MHAFDPNLDDDFVMVDADVSYGEVRDLVAKQLLGNGAAAFVGAHWEVTDDLALRFATKF